MGLADYGSKRDFARTPEPQPRPASSATGNLFVVHKHAARSLHYDLRLEMGGVLKSWAVPKGPSLDPTQKRLAVQVEDHPLDYADFEGTIPEGQYGGGTVMVWDRGQWLPETDPVSPPPGEPAELLTTAERALQAGRLRFRLEGQKLRGGWALVRLRDRPGEQAGKDWLLIKERDEAAAGGSAAEITARAPNSVKTGRSLAEIADGAPASPGETPADETHANEMHPNEMHTSDRHAGEEERARRERRTEGRASDRG